MSRFRIVPEQSRFWIDASSSLHAIHSETDGLEGWFEAEWGERGIDGTVAPRGHLELGVGRLTSGDGRYFAGGDVTFRGVTRPVDGELTVRLGNGVVRISGERVFDVRDFGFEPPKILMLKVHPEVTVRIEVVAEANDSALAGP